jgi:hypothetical protein
MARDFEDIHDLDDLSDDELRELVRTHLASHKMLDPDDIDVRVEDGIVHLGGRVGTEAERRVAIHVVTDVLGIEQVENEMVIDPIRRGASPEAIDEHLADEEERSGILLADHPETDSDEVSQVHGDEDLDRRLYGTTDVQASIAHGTAWIPPERPTPEGLEGSESDLDDEGEQH